MVRLYFFSQGGTIPWNITLAALMLAAIPAIIIFLIFQKRIMQGISLTGLKI
jgi:multiple sugar transport system permease protein